MKKFFHKHKGNEAQPKAPPPEHSKAMRVIRYIFSLDRLYLYIIVSVLLTLTIESLSRRSVAGAFVFVYENPLAFIVNCMIVLITLSFSMIFKKRLAVLTLISAVWLGLGITQFVLLSFRVTPFTAVDFSILKSVFSIIGIYLSATQIALLAAAILLGVGVVIFLFIKSPRHRVKLSKALISTASAGLILTFSSIAGYSSNALSDKFTNLSEAYNDYGFAYCFSMSIFDKGVDEPENYSDESVADIMERIEEEANENNLPDVEEKPNVIYVQLESFFDVNYLEGFTFSENPIANFEELKRQYPHGFLEVPVIGAGTVNTEFEILTGMSVNDFGTGEYPYKSILSRKACESVAYLLKERGYTAHALHNNDGTFYSRNEVYKNLGFDTFTSIEYMSEPSYTDTGWSKDGVLTDEIIGAMLSTYGRDFVFAVSVQAHGKYPYDYTPEEGKPYVIGGEDDAQMLSAYNYYINQLYEMDIFIKELHDAVLAFEEPVVLVLYGDHFPSLQIDDEMLSDGSTFTTEYVMITNYDSELEFEGGDTSAYMLSSHVMAFIGCDSGVINRLHVYMKDSPEHKAMLQALEYDTLYGECYSCGGIKERYTASSDMKMGYDEITFDSFEIIGDFLYVYGSGFTEYSAICIDSSVKDGDTEFIDSGTLRLNLGIFDDFDYVCVAQVNVNGVVLSMTPALTIRN